jgi:hypothetical protein
MRGTFVVIFIQFQTLSHADEYQTRTYDMTTRDFNNVFIIWENWGFLKRKRAVGNRKVVRVRLSLSVVHIEVHKMRR